MAFEGSSFNLFLDSNLTEPFSGLLQLVHYTNLSDNPQDFTLYLGSNLTTSQLQAASSPGVDDIIITPTDILPEWEASTAYEEGDLVQPVGGNTFVYKCTTPGTSDSSEPTWPITPIGDTVSDNDITWTLYSIHHAITEIKLALSSGALGAATPGASLNIGDTVLGDLLNAIPIYIRITNAVTTVSNNLDHEELALVINDCVELGIV